MKLNHLLLLSALWLGSAASSPADEATVSSDAAPLPELMQPYDVDSDGRLSVEERQAYDDAVKEAARLKQQLLWDTDGDGILSPEERQAAMDAIKQKIEAERIARFDELDKDEDGKLSPAEFLGVPNLKPKVVARILNHVDANHDGFISKAEFLAALDPASVKTAQAVLPPVTAPATISPAPALITPPVTGPAAAADAIVPGKVTKKIPLSLGPAPAKPGG
ncbi:MAG: EF-hand domain-containing protein [Verrucomicrobiota bacterium]